MGDDEMSTPALIFISFWGTYYLFHVVVFTTNCIYENIKKKYPYYYDNYNRVVNIEHKRKNWEDNMFDLQNICKESHVNHHNIKFKTYEIEVNNIIV